VLGIQDVDARLAGHKPEGQGHRALSPAEVPGLDQLSREPRLPRYLAGRLAVFSFMTPLFGVLAGVAVLDEPLTPTFAAAALLVGAGIVLVNRR